VYEGIHERFTRFHQCAVPGIRLDAITPQARIFTTVRVLYGACSGIRVGITQPLLGVIQFRAFCFHHLAAEE
jgi:hypothetical protein